MVIFHSYVPFPEGIQNVISSELLKFLLKLTMDTKKLEVDMIQDFGVADHSYLFTSVPVRCLWLL